MSDAVDVAIAKQVVTRLEAAQAAGRIAVPADVEFRPVRSYAEWEKPFDNEHACEVGKLYVDVVLEEEEQKTSAAAKSRRVQYDVPVIIAVRRKFGQESLNGDGLVAIERIDALKRMVQDIYEEFVLERLDGDELAAAWTGTEILNNPAFVHLQQWQQFTGIVLVTFSAQRKAGT